LKAAVLHLLLTPCAAQVAYAAATLLQGGAQHLSLVRVAMGSMQWSFPHDPAVEVRIAPARGDCAVHARGIQRSRCEGCCRCIMHAKRSVTSLHSLHASCAGAQHPCSAVASVPILCQHCQSVAARESPAECF
jgi:hypothetical protein